MKTHLNIKSVYTGIGYDKKLSRPLGIKKNECHSTVNQSISKKQRYLH